MEKAKTLKKGNFSKDNPIVEESQKQSPNVVPPKKPKETKKK